MRHAFVLSALAFASIQPVGAQDSRRTGVYGELFGPAGAYALGVERTLATSGSARLGVRVGASYHQGSFYSGAPVATGWTTRVLAVPAAAFSVFPLARLAGVPVALETEGGLTFTRRSTTRPDAGSARLGLPLHAGAALRTDLADGRFIVRAGFTVGGADNVDYRPVVGVGVGL
ncbi:MAG TPA: hypothetical protein VF576_02165 [Rubricoccaceae bacterium]|jgi:hypothetical protein